MSFFKQTINTDLVIQAIEDGEELDSDQRQSAKELVWVLAETYLERDNNESKVLFTEEYFQSEKVAGTIDLIQEVRYPIYIPKSYNGKKLVVDWKTSNSSTFDKSFRERYVDSWQWKIYSYYSNADLFEYRIISKSTGDTLEILLKNSDEIRKSVENYLLGVNLLLSSLMEREDLYVWPRHMPSGCNTYGKPCPFLERVCQYDHYIPSKSISLPLHYTTVETFLTCPERFRLTEVTKNDYGIDTKSSSETAIGSAVHRGMEEIYTQLKEKQKCQ